MSYIVHGGPLAWALIAAFAAALAGGLWLRHRIYPKTPGAHVPRRATAGTGGRHSPRPAAGSAPGGKDGLLGDTVVLPAGDDWDGEPAPRDWGRSHMPSAAERTEQLAAIGSETDPPWLPAPEPVVVEPAMTPLPEDERRPDYGWLYRDDPQPQQRAADWTESDQALCLCHLGPDVPGEPITSEADCPAHGDEGRYPSDVVLYPRECPPPACRLCDSEGHVTTGHDQLIATERQADAHDRNTALLLAGAMMLGRLAATQPALPRLGSLDHLEQRLWTTETDSFAAICGADDLIHGEHR